MNYKKLISLLFILNISCSQMNGETDSDTITILTDTDVIPTTTIPPITSLECDIWEQNCIWENRKCTASSKTKDLSWNENTCQIFDTNSLKQNCWIKDFLTSGMDTCGKGLICVPNGEGELEGICEEFCTGIKDNPICPEGKVCEVFHNGVMPLCM